MGDAAAEMDNVEKRVANVAFRSHALRSIAVLSQTSSQSSLNSERELFGPARRLEAQKNVILVCNTCFSASFCTGGPRGWMRMEKCS